MNNKDDKEKEQIKIDIENLEDMSEEEIIELISNLTSTEEKAPNKISFSKKIINVLILYIKKLVIDFILIFVINSFIQVIDASFINFIIYFLVFNMIDFIFNRYLTVKFPILMMITFGVINFIVTFLSFIVSGIICLQIIDIEFSKFITYFIAIIIFYIIKKFVQNYFTKLRKRGSKNVSN